MKEAVGREGIPSHASLLIFRIVHGGDAEGIVPFVGCAAFDGDFGIAVAERGGTGHPEGIHINALNGRFFLLAELRDPPVG